LGRVGTNPRSSLKITKTGVLPYLSMNRAAVAIETERILPARLAAQTTREIVAGQVELVDGWARAMQCLWPSPSLA